MGRYVNSVIPYAAYEDIFSDKYFVDKSMLLDELISTLGLKNRFLCVTRPRRFGKSVMANMIGAFFGKAQDASMVFDHLSIAHVPGYHKHLNQHNVLYIDFSRLPRNCTSYEQYINRIQDGINQDLKDIYPDLRINIEDATWDILTDVFQKKSDKFIFVMDEWDAVFHMDFVKEKDKREYLLFLTNVARIPSPL